VGEAAHHPGLDGLRGVAIALVLGQHAPTRPLIDGFVGVTVFFCLSGFLITTLLVRELESGGLDVRAFYRRRAARLVPGLATVTATTTVVLLVDRRDLSAGQVLAPAAAAMTYVTSLFDWSGHVFATKDYFNYTWSLSVEEQFYVAWPFALLWGYRRRPRLLGGVVAGLVVGTLVLDVYLGSSRAVKYDQHEYFGTDTNALPILVGALLAMAIAEGWLTWAVRSLASGALAGLALLPALAYRNDTYRPALVTVAGTGLSLVALTGVVNRPRSLAGSLLSTHPMRWLGERAYSIYLWNVLARIAVLAWLGHTLVGDLVWVALFLPVAELSFRLVERPLRARLAGGHPGGIAPPGNVIANVAPPSELCASTSVTSPPPLRATRRASERPRPEPPDPLQPGSNSDSAPPSGTPEPSSATRTSTACPRSRARTRT
jgi:peptidoglycan/LPS O-acetylase OafA/YrhL